MNISTPKPFAGSAAEKAANAATHDFDPQYGRCMACDCRPWGAVAEYPCGTEPEREVVSAPEANKRYQGTPLAGAFG